MLTSNKLKTKVAFALLPLLLAACAGGGAPSVGSWSGAQHNVRLTASDASLHEAAANMLNGKGIVPVDEDAVSAMTLVLSGNNAVQHDPRHKTGPRIVGVLKREQRPSFFRIDYTLIDSRGNKLAEDSVVGQGGMQTGMYPTLPADSSTAQPQALQSALTQLAASLQRDLRSQTWRSQVVSLSPSTGKVLIAADERNGLRQGQQFAVLGQGGVRLEFVGYEEDLNGNTQAALQVIQGNMPPVGSVVELLDKRS